MQNAYDSSMGSKLKRSHDLLFHGDTFENFSRCSSSDHTECLQVEPADNVTIRDSVFRRCDTIVINFANDLAGDSKSAAGYAAPNNVLIENNFLDEAMDHTGGPTYYALNIRECTNCTIRYNSWLQEPRMPNGEVSLNNRFIGNLGPMSPWNCYDNGVSYSLQRLEAAPPVVDRPERLQPRLPQLDPGSFDLHLAPGSPALNHGDPGGYPSRDFDGQSAADGLGAGCGCGRIRVAAFKNMRYSALIAIGCCLALLASAAATNANPTAPGKRASSSRRRDPTLVPAQSAHRAARSTAATTLPAQARSIQAAGGSYGDQTFSTTLRRPTRGETSVIRPAKHARVTIGDLKLGHLAHCQRRHPPDGAGDRARGHIIINGCGQPSDGQQCPANSGGNYIQLYNLDVRGTYGFGCASCDHVSLLNSRIGPVAYGNPCNGSAHPEVQNAYDSSMGSKLKRSHDLLFQAIPSRTSPAARAPTTPSACRSSRPTTSPSATRSSAAATRS